MRQLWKSRLIEIAVTGSFAAGLAVLVWWPRGILYATYAILVVSGPWAFLASVRRVGVFLNSNVLWLIHYVVFWMLFAVAPYWLFDGWAEGAGGLGAWFLIFWSFVCCSRSWPGDTEPPRSIEWWQFWLWPRCEIDEY